MAELIITTVVGIACIVIGISNMRGNISSLHSYHTARVSEEDKIPFGKKVGLGTIIIGVGLMAFGGLTFAAGQTGEDAFALIGTAVLIVGLIVGAVISLGAIKKYNKGIF